MVFCDRLVFSSFFALLKLSLGKPKNQERKLIILDKIGNDFISKLLLFGLRIIGYYTKEAEFFAGNLKSRKGKVIGYEARYQAKEMALVAAKQIMQNSRFLRDINSKWKRNTVELYIAKCIVNSLMITIQHFLVAESLGEQSGYSQINLVVKSQLDHVNKLIESEAPSLKPIYYRKVIFRPFLETRFSVFVLIVYKLILRFFWRCQSIFKEESYSYNRLKQSLYKKPVLLALQEGDISLDRSYRTQPHWLFENDERLRYSTVILNVNRANSGVPDGEMKRLVDHNVFSIDRRELVQLSDRHGKQHPVFRKLKEDIWGCLYRALFGFPHGYDVLFYVLRLLLSSNDLARFCLQHEVKAFITAENYLGEASSMQLINKDVGVKTISYQYSNIGQVGAILMTTSDTMITFSSSFHNRWSSNDIRPGRFIDSGYTFDSSFAYVEKRSKDYRSTLTVEGAKFIICYFDESVATDKYGLVSIENHCEEVRFLFQQILNDSTLGLIVKTQFNVNSPKNLKQIKSIRESVIKTGRYIELGKGSKRNSVFPAEAAMVSDITIGHAIGSTASLEAALSGVRSIMLNPYGFIGEDTEIYNCANIVYPSIQDSVTAIQRFRSGDSKYQDLGDWKPIIGHFDRYNDGRAGRRLRNIIDEIVCT